MRINHKIMATIRNKNNNCNVGLLLLWMVFLSFNNQVNGITVTNEDIRDAILQVVNVARNTEDKLERHEYRERVLGEQLKKGLISIDKRIKLLDPFKGTVNRLDERLAAVETILMQKDERERIQLQRTFDTVEDIDKNLPLIVAKLKSDIIEKLSSSLTQYHQTTDNDDDRVSKKDFDLLAKKLSDKFDQVTSTIKSMENDLIEMRHDHNRTMRELTNKSSENLDKVKRQLDTSEQLLEKYENKLAEYNNRIPEIIRPSANDIKEQSTWHTNFMQALDMQKSHLDLILSDVKIMSSRLNKLPDKIDIEIVQNTTLDRLAVLNQKSDENNNNNNSINSAVLDAKLADVNNLIDQKHKETADAINMLANLTEGIIDKFSTNYGQIRDEIEKLGKIEQVMIQTGDNVLDTKRRVEYGIHQILAEVSQLIKSNLKQFNTNINERFDSFELSILDEDSGALANLTSKIGEDIDQVWRQIGIMHQQMSASTDTLNKLQNQTDAYVNGSLGVMDNMKGKVGKITGRITEVDENLNFLLGKLSLVTQEFNQIKSGLGKALDEMRATFKSVDDKAKGNNIYKDPGPGPHNISSNEIIDDNKSSSIK